MSDFLLASTSFLVWRESVGNGRDAGIEYDKWAFRCSLIENKITLAFIERYQAQLIGHQERNMLPAYIGQVVQILTQNLHNPDYIIDTAFTDALSRFEEGDRIHILVMLGEVKTVVRQFLLEEMGVN